MARAVTLSLALLLAAAVRAPAQESLPAPLRQVGFDQKLDAQVPADLEFRDESGRPVRLGDYFSDRPVILVLAYFRCPMLCGQVLNGLTQTMLDLPLELGKDYRVVTVSFDPRETPAMAAAKRKQYLQRVGRDADADGWHFLTGDADAIQRLTDAVGFRYSYDPVHDQFAHASGLVLLTPEGKVSRYFFDVRYSPRDLRLGLVEASHNRIGTAADQILLYCFHYDPAEGKYGPAVMNFVRLGGVLTLVGLAVFAACLWRREWRVAETKT